ncbi:hypothetical protein C8Q76DRAFT_134322 [Earliella scabrosa]|nr:hypothetical protein C8Q76DRAFT_134322 [Earliella scabrosa]
MQCLLLWASCLAVGFAIASAQSTYITYPNQTSVWIWGYQHNVTWDQNHWLGEATHPVIKLFKGDLDTHNVLAKEFNLTQGRVEVTVPSVEEGSDYVIRLYYQAGTNTSLPSTSSATEPVSASASATTVVSGQNATSVATEAPSESSPNTPPTSPMSTISAAQSVFYSSPIPPSNATVAPSTPVASGSDSTPTEEPTSTEASPCECGGASASASVSPSSSQSKRADTEAPYIVGAKFTIREHPLDVPGANGTSSVAASPSRTPGVPDVPQQGA